MDSEPRRPRRLIHRLLRVLNRNTDSPSPPDPREPRMDAPPSDTAPRRGPRAQAGKTWAQTRAFWRGQGQPVQLHDSRAEPGGVPVYADPDMVTPAAAEKMRPLFRR